MTNTINPKDFTVEQYHTEGESWYSITPNPITQFAAYELVMSIKQGFPLMPLRIHDIKMKSTHEVKITIKDYVEIVLQSFINLSDSEEDKTLKITLETTIVTLEAILNDAKHEQILPYWSE